MKRLLAFCLLIPLLFLCLPLSPAAAAAKDDLPGELKLMQSAQALYDEITDTFRTAGSYQTHLWNRLEGFRKELSHAELYNFVYDYFINITTTLTEIVIGAVTLNAAQIIEATGGLYVELGIDDILNRLKLTAPVTVAEFIYAQADSALNDVTMSNIRNVMERAENNGGKLASYLDAAILLYQNLKNETAFSTLKMASGYYDKQTNRNLIDIIRELTVKISLSEIAGSLEGNFVVSTGVNSLLSFGYEFYDGIGQQAHEPCVSAWVREQKALLAEMEKFSSAEDHRLDLQDLSQPSWIAQDAGKWTCTGGEACELELKVPDGRPCSLQLYFPAADRTMTAVYAGIDSRHRAVFLDPEHNAVIRYSRAVDEITLWLDRWDGGSYGNYHGAPEGLFVRQEYAWTGHWVNTENPETVLDITSNGDGTLHLAAHFAPDLSFAFDFPPVDYEILYFDTLEKPFPADMRIDGYTGMLEFALFSDQDTGMLNSFPGLSSLFDRLRAYSGIYFFTTDNPPDLTRFGWIPYEEPRALSEEETADLFARLSETPLLAASGAGAWEGHMRVSADGRFSGTYEDADADMLYRVSFSGAFDRYAEAHGDSCWLRVDDLITAQAPGTEGTDEYGDPVTYTDPPFGEGEYLVLTLPGTPDEAIPEMVQGEIGGTYDIWEDFSRFTTLTRLEDGWGFFTDLYSEEPAPVPDSVAPPTAEPAEAADPGADQPPAGDEGSGWTGYWMTRDGSLAEMIITDNGDGTLHAKAMFLPAADSEATLTPQADGSLRFEDQYGHLTGTIFPGPDGELHLHFTGGSTMEDEEATEYQGYYAKGFTFYPADYPEMWYQTPEDAAGPDSDWLGNWMSTSGTGLSSLRIWQENGVTLWALALGNYDFSGTLETDTPSSADLISDDFFGMLILNRKLKRIALLEVGSDIEGVYDWLSAGTNYGVAMYEPVPDITFSIPEQEMPSISESVFTIPGSGALDPQDTAALLPVPGRADCLQIPVAGTDATSYIVSKKDPAAYAPQRMLDGDETTSFQFSAKETPPGEAWVYFDFDGPVSPDELWIKNGFWKGSGKDSQFIANGRIRKMTLFVRDAGTEDYRELKSFSFRDETAPKDWTVISLPEAKNITGVCFRIDQVYRGTKFPADICISEIMFVQNK